jgi:hypothetical protein
MGNDMLKAMKEHFQNPANVFKMKADFRKKEEAKQRNLSRIRKIIDPLNTEDFKDFMIKFFEWETKYEDIFYKRNILTCSRFLNKICDIASADGMELSTDDDEYGFLASRHQYKHFVFELYVGQGSFWRIYHTTDKEVSFQTT